MNNATLTKREAKKLDNIVCKAIDNGYYDTKEYRKRMFENIYDLIKGGEFEDVARKELKKFIYNKHLQWDGDNNTISLGKYFVIKLV